jgi:hypothetical protein
MAVFAAFPTILASFEIDDHVLVLGREFALTIVLERRRGKRTFLK